MSLQMFISIQLKVGVFSTEALEDLKSPLIYTGHNLTMITWTIFTLDFEKNIMQICGNCSSYTK